MGIMPVCDQYAEIKQVEGRYKRYELYCYLHLADLDKTCIIAGPSDLLTIFRLFSPILLPSPLLNRRSRLDDDYDN